jgi:hypothetical protein
MHKTSYLKIVLVIVFILTAVSIGYTGWKNLGNSANLKDPSDDNAPVNMQDTPTEPMTTHNLKIPETDVSYWKIYRNEKYGFEINYPSNGKVNESPGSPERIPQVLYIVDFNYGPTNIHIYENKQLLPVREWYATFLEGREFSVNDEPRKFREVIVNNQKGLEVSSAIIANQVIRTFFPSKDIIIGIEAVLAGPEIDPADLKQYNRIRETFRLR